MLTCVDQQQRPYKHTATTRTHRHPRSAPVATSILASNAYLNPLLGHNLSSARAYSTTSSNRAAEAAVEYDPVEDEIKASIERKHQASLHTKEIEGQARRENRAQRKDKLRLKPNSTRALQAEQKPRLIRELQPSSDSQGAPTAFEDLGPEDLERRLAELEERLEAAKLVNWDELFQDAQEERNLKNQKNYTNLHRDARLQAGRVQQEIYEAKVKELKKQKLEHQAATKQLEGGYAALKVYIARQKAKDQGKDEEVNEHEKARQELKKKKEDLLRKKDLLAVRMAQLRASQAHIATSTPRTLSPQHSHELSPVEHNPSASPSPIDPSSLHIKLPGGSYKIDSSLTIDITEPLPSLKQQLAQLQQRLRAFHPPLDSLPLNVEAKGPNNTARDKYVFQTYLKVLVGRYQSKTGVLGRPGKTAEVVSEKESGRVEGMSEEAKERMAKRWNEVFAERKGFVMTPGALEEMHKNQEALQAAQRAGSAKAGAEVLAEVDVEEYNENAFLEDEYATEEEMDAAHEELETTAQESPLSKRTLPPLSRQMIEADKDNKGVILEDGYATGAKTRAANDHLETRTITMWDTGETVSVPSTRPALDDSSFAAWALHQLSNPSNNASQTKEEARETLEHNLKAVELGWGSEDDRLAAQGLPDQYKPENITKNRYEHMERYDPAAPSGLAQTREKDLLPEWAQDEKEVQDAERNARAAHELQLLRKATSLRQDEEASSSKAEEANKPRSLITYEGSNRDKGYVMKKQKKAVADQKKKMRQLRKQAKTPKPAKIRLTPSTSMGASMQANSQDRSRRPLTVRQIMRRAYSTSSRAPDALNQGLAAKEQDCLAPASKPPPAPAAEPHLPHLTSTGSAHMVSISAKSHTTRTAIAVGTVYFSNPTPLSLITSNSLKKGDVLSVSRVAGIMAAKKCPDIVPLCHPIPLTHVGVELRTFAATSPPASTSYAGRGNDEMGHGGVAIECKVACTGATGVEMEALTAVMGTALSVVDMCKAVDKFQRIGGVRVVLKEGGKSGTWREESWKSWQEE